MEFLIIYIYKVRNWRPQHLGNTETNTLILRVNAVHCL